ncbi:seminal metalloprotease 1-like [Teleopsis dalmanni]|uniref:seminal metalloprotease 1-like n=1 Tax=Teleopsis dalmanni TaxID=139649 RepID=UPI0018CFB533|nr:seminal metalloprotease 1-like [Teleopsis dalmanni]
MKIFYVFVVFVYLTVWNSASSTQQRIETDPELTAGYFEGDIVLNKDRNGIIKETMHWPNGIVYYNFGDVIDEPHRNHILRGMEMLEQVSCIRFKEADEKQSYYINITTEFDGCFATAGWWNRSQSFNLQLYPLDEGCFRLGTILHELLHTLGFYHQHSTWNRDEYVRIAEENIQPDALHAFEKYNSDFVDNYNEEYDFDSILHYHAYAFSINGEKTIIPLNEKDGANMGQRETLSQSDINKLNAMYRCPRDIKP